MAHRASMVRSAALRSSALSLGEELLDRIEIGRVRRQVEQHGTGHLDRLPHPETLCAGKLSMITMSPGARVGTRQRSTWVRKIRPFIARSMTKGAVTVSIRSPATRVVVFQ